jgi:PadR family transcriptional regulator, regulatory protein PadR
MTRIVAPDTVIRPGDTAGYHPLRVGLPVDASSVQISRVQHDYLIRGGASLNARLGLGNLFDLGKIRTVKGPVRVTRPLLDVLEVLLRAFDSCAGDLHGWAMMKATKRSGPTVYGVLDRLEDAGWISGRWEDENPEPGKPRRRLYRLTPTGASSAQEVLTERRPQALRSLGQAPGPALPGWQHIAPQGGTK